MPKKPAYATCHFCEKKAKNADDFLENFTVITRSNRDIDICDECYEEEYLEGCVICDEDFESPEEPSDRRFYMNENQRGLGGEVKTGFYKVLAFPLFMGCMFDPLINTSNIELVLEKKLDFMDRNGYVCPCCFEEYINGKIPEDETIDQQIHEQAI